MKKTDKRKWVILSAVLVGGALLWLVAGSFTDALVYFHTPSELEAKSAELTGKKVRIGGMVQAGSLTKTPGTMKINFLVTDGNKQIPVFYDGITPDLFHEGQGVIVEGTWRPGTTFVAATILAKHSEDYMPVEMSEEAIEKSKKSILKSLQ